MVKSRNIIRLESDCALIVFFCLLKLPELVPAKGSVVECFEMLWVNLNRILIVLDGFMKLALLPECESSIMVKVGLAGLNLNGHREALDSFIKVALPV